MTEFLAWRALLLAVAAVVVPSTSVGLGACRLLVLAVLLAAALVGHRRVAHSPKRAGR